ncbi:peptidase P60 [Gammaproteobacteria bacterium ESL0073]|uniref:Peptidoglycan endopeptidase n=1 Tax=Entomomonas moraniae TaxID=2213226 RepID=A0A3S9XET8_9GAMM|nr:C40 family peptidase [Entomomonas moraniae]AWM79496.1 peptidase P60 [Gammaproteobacteria bacterium ESL0073]AZS50880.1 peptidoglycan endopeptidase [Entomomonas moraniae]
MKKLFLLCVCLGLASCSSKPPPPSYVTYPTPSSPFDVSLNRELFYEQGNVINTSLFGVKQVFYGSESDVNLAKKPSNSPVINNIISHAYSLVGKPYRYGSESLTKGFDCSGFVGYLYGKEAGIELPRSTRQMIRIDAPKVVSKSKLKPGDVLFFATGKRGQVSHTGIYIGNKFFVHAANSRKGVRIDSLNSGYWSAKFLEAKRIIE